MLSSDELKAAAVEYKSYVEEKQRHHEDSTYAASEIRDVVQFPLRDFGFKSRRHVFRLFKICCLVAGTQNSNPLAVTIDLSGITLNQTMVQDCILMVLSHVFGSSFNPLLFFSGSLPFAVQRAFADSGIFFVSADFDVWKGLRSGDVDAFASRFRSLYKSYGLERSKSCETYFVECNKANRCARDGQFSVRLTPGAVRVLWLLRRSQRSLLPSRLRKPSLPLPLPKKIEQDLWII